MEEQERDQTADEQAQRPAMVANHVAVELCVASVFSEQLRGLATSSFMADGTQTHLPLHFWLIEHPDGTVLSMVATADGLHFTSPLTAESRQQFMAVSAQGEVAVDAYLRSGFVVAAEGRCDDVRGGVAAMVLAQPEPLQPPADAP